jgi:hypothetical protein
MIQTHLSNAGSDDRRFPDFFQFGIRFSPDRYKRDVYRTVTISKIPAEVALSSLLMHIQGGMIVDIKLLNTTSITGSKTALITFLQQWSALKFVDYRTEYPIILHGTATHTAMVNTPTWPFPMGHLKGMKELNHTRCLEVHNFPPGIDPRTFRADLSVHPNLDFDFIEHISMKEGGVLSLRFTSVTQASRALGRIHDMKAYRSCAARFVRDPCDQPLPISRGRPKPQGESEEPL